MTYTVAIEGGENGAPNELLPGTFDTVDEANRAGMAELERRQAPPGSLTFAVYGADGKPVDEAGIGLS